MNKFLTNLKMTCWHPDTGSDGASSVEPDALDIFSMEFEGDGKSQDSGVESGSAGSDGANPNEAVPSEQNGTDSSAGEAGDDTPSASSEPVEQSEPAPAASVASVGPSAEELLAQALEVNKRLSEQLASQKAPKQPSQPEEDEDTKVFAPRKPADYTFTINPQLYEGLFSAEATPEQRIQCLQAYASGIATAVHNNILGTLGKWTKQNFEAVPGAIQYLMSQNAQATQTSAQIRKDFYTKNPDLQRPELYPLLKATIQAVQKETKATAWTQAFADKVATRVRSVLSSYAQATKPKPAAAIITPAAAKPAPKPVDQDPNGMDAIMATLTSDF
mgnify:CR=1 FL=1